MVSAALAAAADFDFLREVDHHHHQLYLNREGRWDTTDDFTTSFLHFSPFSTALWDLVYSRPVHSLILSSEKLMYTTKYV